MKTVGVPNSQLLRNLRLGLDKSRFPCLCSPCNNGSSFQGFNEWMFHVVGLPDRLQSHPIGASAIPRLGAMMIFVSLFDTVTP